MKTKLPAFWTSALFALFQPLPAFAQQTQQRLGDWPGPWHMWSDSPALWWICAIMFTFIGGVVLFLLGQRSGGAPRRVRHRRNNS